MPSIPLLARRAALGRGSAPDDQPAPTSTGRSIRQRDQRLEGAHDVGRTRAERLGERDELDEVEAAFAALDLRDEALWAAETRGEFGLRQAGPLARGAQQGEELVVGV